MIRKKSIGVILLASAGLLLALMYFFIDARHSGFFPVCPFFALTHLYCPGCGSQRAASALLHGDLGQAVNFNALLVISLPFIAYLALINTINISRAKPNVYAKFYSPLLVRRMLIVIVLFGVLRNLRFYPFTLLAP